MSVYNRYIRLGCWHRHLLLPFVFLLLCIGAAMCLCLGVHLAFEAPHRPPGACCQEGGFRVQRGLKAIQAFRALGSRSTRRVGLKAIQAFMGSRVSVQLRCVCSRAPNSGHPGVQRVPWLMTRQQRKPVRLILTIVMCIPAS